MQPQNRKFAILSTTALTNSKRIISPPTLPLRAANCGGSCTTLMRANPVRTEGTNQTFFLNHLQ